MKINQIEWDALHADREKLQALSSAWNELNRFDQAIIYRKWDGLATLLATSAKEESA